VARLRRRLACERGFTLPEVLIVIVLMGIILTIASATWFGIVESRRVDSATNQMVSDLRLAHTSATNRLAPWRIEWTSGSANYQAGPGTSSGFVGTPSSRSLEEGTRLTGTVTAVVFSPDGTAEIRGAGNIEVAAADGSPCHQIEVNTVTSRVKVSSNVC
jgi:prepilin-type N-terminal cleavage/methylation domain-containing protein